MCWCERGRWVLKVGGSGGMLFYCARFILVWQQVGFISTVILF